MSDRLYCSGWNSPQQLVILFFSFVCPQNSVCDDKLMAGDFWSVIFHLRESCSRLDSLLASISLNLLALFILDKDFLQRCLVSHLRDFVFSWIQWFYVCLLWLGLFRFLSGLGLCWSWEGELFHFPFLFFFVGRRLEEEHYVSYLFFV